MGRGWGGGNGKVAHEKCISACFTNQTPKTPPMELCVIKGQQKTSRKYLEFAFVGPTLFKPHVFNIGREHTVGKKFVGTSCIGDVLYFTENQPDWCSHQRSPTRCSVSSCSERDVPARQRPMQHIQSTRAQKPQKCCFLILSY